MSNYTLGIVESGGRLITVINDRGLVLNNTKHKHKLIENCDAYLDCDLFTSRLFELVGKHTGIEYSLLPLITGLIFNLKPDRCHILLGYMSLDKDARYDTVFPKKALSHGLAKRQFLDYYGIRTNFNYELRGDYDIIYIDRQATGKNDGRETTFMVATSIDCEEAVFNMKLTDNIKVIGRETIIDIRNEAINSGFEIMTSPGTINTIRHRNYANGQRPMDTTNSILEDISRQSGELYTRLETSMPLGSIDTNQNYIISKHAK